MKTCLIVTRSDDNPCVEIVSRLLRARGVVPVRLDTDSYPLDVKISTRFVDDDTRRVWITPAGTFDGGDVGSVWYRRFHAGASLPEELGDLRVPAVDESRRALYGMIAALDVPQMDRLEDVRRCDHKELQLQRARALGLTIPKTLFSDDEDEVRSFFAVCGGRMITKMQSSFAVMRDGLETVVFTNVIDDDALRDLSGLRFCPMQFQELVDKRLELRATVVGDAIFCAAVDSQTHSDETRIDWRKDGVGLLKKWAPYQLPSSTSKALLQLVRSFGLSYAAADFIVTPDDRLVFLEINAGGEWFWLDESLAPTGLPIASAIATWLAR
ncbi:MAG: MvdD family ATP-grasp ribosomal peptide maturase [Deltaproteobacteria bacterium]|nr:MvdD family ATP-grasp ribosomal peptide maturase [Deltaproteobacteria bacterium]